VAARVWNQVSSEDSQSRHAGRHPHEILAGQHLDSGAHADSLCRYGFVVYQDPNVTDIACAGLNGMRMGERTLTVRRATEVKSCALLSLTKTQLLLHSHLHVECLS